MSILVCLDRDGTINNDENYYLGSQDNWKDLVEFLPGVIDGIKLLNSINSHIFIITNQSSVAIKEFPNFTEKRMHEVNNYILKKLEEEGVIIEECISCPYVNSTYVKKKQGKYTVDEKYVDNSCLDLKPNIGMVEKAKSKLPYEVDQIYVIGDRLSDVKVGLNAGGISILVPSYKTKELDDIEKVQKLENTYIAKDLLDAANYILSQQRK